MQKKLKKMDLYKNIEKYKFNPNYTSSTLKERRDRTSDFDLFENIRGNKLNKTNQFPLINFYKKVNTPYKYKINNIPEHLIKSNEEKIFLNKLYESLKNEKDKKTLIDLLNKNAKKNSIKKDFLKKKYIDVQKMLKNKPNLYTNIFDPLKRNKNKLTQNQKSSEIKKENITFENNTNAKNYFNNNEYILKNINKSENNINNITNEINKINNVNKKVSKEEPIKNKDLRKEAVILNKSAEKYLFNYMKNKISILNNTSPNMNHTITDPIEKKENKLYISSEGNTNWLYNKINKQKKRNNSNVVPNILSQNYNGTNKFNNAFKLNKNNLYIESPVYPREKSISEFIDLTRVSTNNIIGGFTNKNMKIPNFKFNINFGNNQLDMHHINRDISDKSM